MEQYMSERVKIPVRVEFLFPGNKISHDYRSTYFLLRLDDVRVARKLVNRIARLVRKGVIPSEYLEVEIDYSPGRVSVAELIPNPAKMAVLWGVSLGRVGDLDRLARAEFTTKVTEGAEMRAR